MLRDLAARTARAIVRRMDGRRSALRRFAASRAVWMRGPYPIGRYGEALDAVLEAGFRTPPFGSGERPGAVPDVFFRHDIDLAACPARVEPMVAAALRRAIVPGVYFQANDRAPYVLRECRGLAQELMSGGAEIGLHTICYTAEDPFAMLAEERARFEDALGISPRSFNAHGLGRYMLSERLAFYRKIDAARLKQLGFAFSDLHPGLRRYDHVAEDCHAVDAEAAASRTDPFALARPEERLMRDDVLGLPRLRGLRYLVLTHPGYWTG
jgi:hypothetical protein